MFASLCLQLESFDSLVCSRMSLSCLQRFLVVCVLNRYLSSVLYSIFKVLRLIFLKPVGLSGLEPPTSRLSGVRSNRLSYKPLYGVPDFISTLGMSRGLINASHLFRHGRRRIWNFMSKYFFVSKSLCTWNFMHGSCLTWRWRDSNSWPPACKAGALPTELHPHIAATTCSPISSPI